MNDTEEHLISLNVLNLNDISHSVTLTKAICYGMKEEKHAKQIISLINKQLSSAPTRDKALSILSLILPHCSSKILDDNCILWTNFCMSHHPYETVPALRFNVASKIIHLCHKNQDFNKAITGNLLSKIIDASVAVTIKSNVAKDALKCLNVCLRTYPSTCIVYKKKVETYLIQFLDASVTQDVLNNAATCFHYLNQIGGAGSSGSTHIKNYNDNFDKMCNTLNNLYDELFRNVNEFENYSTTTDNIHEFKILSSSLQSSDITRIRSRRLRNVTMFITKMLECSFTLKKCFNPNNLLKILQRGLSVHIHADITDLNQSLDSFVLQEHQIDLLHLLKALISCLKQNFMHFSSIKILLDCLLRTKVCDCFKQESEYQITTYEVLKYWIINSGEQIETKLYDKLIKHIISDITPLKTAIVLNIANTKKTSIKVKNKTIQDKIIKSADVNKNDVSIKLQQNVEEISNEALATLELLLKKIPLTINDNVCTILFDTMVQILLNISVNVFEVPYTNKNCRIALYKAMIAIFDQSVATLDIALTINILNIGVRSYDSEISHICQDGICQLEKICQPIHPTLYINFGNKITIEPERHQKDVEKDNEEMETCEFGGINLSKVINPATVPLEDTNITPIHKENGHSHEDVINDNLDEEADEMEPLVVDDSPQNTQTSSNNSQEEPEEVYANDKITKNNLVELHVTSDNNDEVPIKKMKMCETIPAVGDADLMASFVDEVNDY